MSAARPGIMRFVDPSLKHVARSSAYFTRKDVIREVMRRAGVIDAVIDVRRRYRGLDLDQLIVAQIGELVSDALRQRDAHGIRVFECYSVPGGERRWRRLRDMNRADLARVVEECRVLRDQIDAKLRVYERLLNALEDGATVDAVYDTVVKKINRRMVAA